MAQAGRRLAALATIVALISVPATPAIGAPVVADPDARILHALNRLTFGPRPGDVERVRRIGLDAWIEAQLSKRPGPDAAVDVRLAGLETLAMTPVELMVAYPPPQLIRGLERVLTGPLGRDAGSVADMFPEIERIRRRQSANQDGRDPREAMSDSARAREMSEGSVRIVFELSQAKLVRATYSEHQLQEVMTDFWFNHFNVFIGKNSDRWWTTRYEYDAIRPRALGNFRELLGAVARHPAMLFYLDNWMSSAPDARFDRRESELLAARANREQGLPPGGVATLLLRERGMDTRGLEREVNRRNEALNSWRNRLRSRFGQSESRRTGLNENYARELLELHTLGVDGGYTQKDIVEVARCFTGWTLLPIQSGQGFVFVPELHDPGTKTVLGKKIRGRGMLQGEQVLDLLAAHPSTARFVSTKLARRFVRDDPPPALVDKMAAAFIESKGEIASVLRAMFRSAEFWSGETVGAKFKTPFEFSVSVLRATQADVLPLPWVDAKTRAAQPALLHALRQLGQPLYGAQPPTGYDDNAESWVSTGALLGRLKLAVRLASNRVPGIDIAWPEDGTPDGLGKRLIGRAPSANTVASIERQLDRPPAELKALGFPPGLARKPEMRNRLTMAWLLASPEFQRK